jgi:hypothetical protein
MAPDDTIARYHVVRGRLSGGRPGKGQSMLRLSIHISAQLICEESHRHWPAG